MLTDVVADHRPERTDAFASLNFSSADRVSGMNEPTYETLWSFTRSTACGRQLWHTEDPDGTCD
jgi:hypothetical protein